MDKLNIAVLRGGPSSEYDVSLKTGASILEHLNREKYTVRDVLITKDGIWHTRGMSITPIRLLQSTDVVVNALHGQYGEDGTIQKLLDHFKVPYTGSGAASSALAMNKVLTKERLKTHGVRMAGHAIVNQDEKDVDQVLFEAFGVLSQPIVVKPVSCGSSVGVIVTEGYPALVDGVRRSFDHCPKVLLEEYVTGREATCGVLERFRNEPLSALSPIEIVPPEKHTFFDYTAKYSGETQEICPGNFTEQENEELKKIARQAHEVLGLRHYSRSDFIIAKDGIYYLETNTLPGLTAESLLPKAVAEAGLSFSEFLDHLIGLAKSR